MRHPLVFALAAVVAGSVASAQSTQPLQVPAFRETTPGPAATGGLIQDVAVWVGSPVAGQGDAGIGLLLTAYDNQNSGLSTFGLDGQQLEQEQDGPTVSVAVRDGFRLGPSTRSLAVTANTVVGLSAYVVDGFQTTNRVQRIGVGPFVANSTTFNTVALYRSPGTGRFFVFAGTADGSLQQFELSGEDGGLSSTLVRPAIDVGGPITGLVADEELGFVYVVQAGEAIWRYNAEPNGGTSRVLVASLSATGSNLSSTVNRLALYRAANAEGYLLAADTGAGTFAVLDRRTYAFLGSFRVTAGDGGLDAVEAPRALAVSALPMGLEFPQGLFVAQDSNNGGTDNLKLLRWEAVAAAFTPPLRVDTRPSTGDGGTDAGSDGGLDGGGIGGGGGRPSPGGGGIDLDNDTSGCTCAAASVPGSVLLGLLALGLSVRRRRER
ncbi:phytase [Myxococcus sp. CA051A]|uniref:myxosortase-dependent phytase-like phosphatase n=1 Tax=Myxococcus sp. CA051A TaxID=2741739 RepID=UPI00157A5D5F|nr:myxosortase-dependent phytase-like phosphatase [Myxococcus sp. CA051A]NTX59626.1 phytase [Myxococcus sp. CA051A]